MSWQITSFHFLLPATVMKNYLISVPSTRHCHDKLPHSSSFYQVLSWQITSFHFLLPGTVMKYYLISLPSGWYCHDKLPHFIPFYQVLSWQITSFHFLLPGTVMKYYLIPLPSGRYCPQPIRGGKDRLTLQTQLQPTMVTALCLRDRHFILPWNMM